MALRVTDSEWHEPDLYNASRVLRWLCAIFGHTWRAPSKNTAKYLQVCNICRASRWKRR